MGCYQPVSIFTKVLSLNYGGILNSPFQFYSPQNQEQLQKISEIFQKNLIRQNKKYSKSSFKWELGKIDVNMQKQRYSCLYNQNVGVQKGYLLTENDYSIKWKSVFQKNYQQLKNKFQVSDQQKTHALKFDYMCYKAILDYLYGEQADLTHQSVSQYKKFMEKYFSLPFLNQQNKIKKTIQAIHSLQIHICFFMEASQNLINALKKQSEFQLIIEDKVSSIIVLKKDRFKKINNVEETKKYLKDFYKHISWDGDTLVGIADDIVLISAHLSSKNQKKLKASQINVK